jgi:carotenoid cleavage dioxygenase
MPNPILSALRAAIESSVQFVAAYNRMRLPKTSNPFLVGIHDPMVEELTLLDLTVTGPIPAQINGRYLKIGVNPVRPATAGHSWFLGDGMVHGIAVEDGKAV